MPPNLKKSGSSPTRTSEASGGFSAPRKPSENAATQRGLNFTAERELGSAGGIKATGKLTVGVDSLLGQQGVTIEADAANKTLGVGVNVGSARGKLGVNIGGKIGHDERGNISIRGAEAAINIGGFGGSASIDDEKGIGGSISVAGGKIEVTVSPDGKKTLSLCYGVPGGELCTTFEPDPGIKILIPPPSPPIRPGLDLPPPLIPPASGEQYLPLPFPGKPNIPLLPPSNERCYYAVHYLSIDYDFRYYYKSEVTPHVGYFCTSTKTTGTVNNGTVSGTSIRTERNQWSNYPIGANVKPYEQYTINPQIVYATASQINNTYLASYNQYYYETEWQGTDANPGYHWYVKVFSIRSVSVTEIHCPNALPPKPIEGKVQLPNYPQNLKPMDCCEEIKEIHRFLGIGKFKKKKFAVANQFLAPGATGNTECADYYELEEAKIRMMANGLILNPVSSPNGTPWQTVNATAWAGQMYEMMAESMSDGNQTQKVEIALMMQLSQMMKVIAEMKREIEFLSQCIGITPELDTEDLPICFTIFQGHKGFGKKDKKLIDITSQKTDAQVEMTLTEMLQPSKIPITVRRFKPDSISIIEALRQI